MCIVLVLVVFLLLYVKVNVEFQYDVFFLFVLGVFVFWFDGCYGLVEFDVVGNFVFKCIDGLIFGYQL